MRRTTCVAVHNIVAVRNIYNTLQHTSTNLCIYYMYVYIHIYLCMLVVRIETNNISCVFLNTPQHTNMCCGVHVLKKICCSVLQCLTVCEQQVLRCAESATHCNAPQQIITTITNCNTLEHRFSRTFIVQHMFVCWGAVQCVCVCCSVLLCAAVRCCVLQCVAVCCSVLQCVALCCIVLHCSVVQCVAVCCSVLQCVAVCCSVVQ